MPGRYAAFTFVDRIVSFEPGGAARGVFHIPADAGHFPASLLAEATGQLAAWAAVAKQDFRVRPVAGVAHETIYRGEPRPGDLVETEIRIDSCDDAAVSYQGAARIRGETVVELNVGRAREQLRQQQACALTVGQALDWGNARARARTGSPAGNP